MIKILVYFLGLLVAVGVGVFMYFGLGESGGRSELAGKVDGYQLPAISPEEVKRKLDQGLKNFTLIDVRTDDEYTALNIPAATHIPLGDGSGFGLAAQKAIPDKNREIILFCRSGIRSQTAGEILHSLGYTHLWNMGGILDWPYLTGGRDGTPGKARAAGNN